MGRITGYISPEGTVSYTYDANSNVLTVTDSHGTITRTYDALNRVTSYTDTYGKVIRYEYDAVGNLTRIIYPDNTAVTYAYDANHNLIRVTDWSNRVTAYTYDVNNRVTGVTKPDGSTTTTVYDSKQRVTSTVERTASGTVITGFEYTYDDLSRIIEEKVLANSTKMCYSYDSLNRVTSRTVKRLANNSVISTETYTYDAAGNLTDAPGSCFQYDTNNQLVVFNGNTVSYDLDGNMLSNGSLSCTYDSANRLIFAGGHTYTYNAEDVRIRNLCTDEDTTYTYDTNGKLSKLLCKTTGGVTTKYVYGRGLIGEEVNSTFKTYHFDCRGSTIAVTDANGNITDTFAYDTYGKLTGRTGTNNVIFGYNGRDGVITDDNGLYYMRARYYCPDMRRFVNADIVAGKISNAVTLNRFAYANGNPVSFIDPFGLAAERAGLTEADYEKFLKTIYGLLTFSKKEKLSEFRVDVGFLTFYQNYELTFGNGSVDIDKLIDKQIELSQSIDFSEGTFKLKTGTDIKLGIEYSVDINDFNSVSVSFINKVDGTISAEYQISTEYNNGSSLATTIGVETNKNYNLRQNPSHEGNRDVYVVTIDDVCRQGIWIHPIPTHNIREDVIVTQDNAKKQSSFEFGALLTGLTAGAGVLGLVVSASSGGGAGPGLGRFSLCQECFG